MSSIVIAVFKATIGLLVNKGRDKAAEKLKDGDVTDQTFRGLIVREIDDIKSKLDGISRKDLLASISFFEEGIELLYEVFDKATCRSIRSEDGALSTQAACAEAFSLEEEMRILELTDLDESATRALSNAKERFKDARRKATEAFKNEALETSDRILAMQYRVMATILETVDNPECAVAPCRVCIKELNSLPAVQNCFYVQLKKGIQTVSRRLLGKDERRKIISTVCHVNRVIYDVTKTVGKDANIWIWPAVDAGDKVDPLRDGRVTKVLCKQGMEHCCVTWSFGQEGEEEHKLKGPSGIATNYSGQFIVGDSKDKNVKVFDSKGTFVKLLSLPNDKASMYVLDVATDMNDNIYVLVQLGRGKPVTERDECVVYKFNNTAEFHHKFPLRGDCCWGALTVTDSGKVLVLKNDSDYGAEVDVYKTDGQFVCTFRVMLKRAYDITHFNTSSNNGRFMVVDMFDRFVHIFSEHGNHLSKFKLQGCHGSPRIAFHRASEHIVIACVLMINLLLVEIYTKDGELVRSTRIHEERIAHLLEGMTVTSEGRIAVLTCGCCTTSKPPKVLVL